MYIKEARRYLQHHRILPKDSDIRFPRWRSPLFGYPAGLLLTIAMVITNLHVRQMNFIWPSFCLGAVIIGFVWGVSPALVTIILGFLGFNLFIVPHYGLVTMDIWNNVRIVGPFTLAQLGMAFLSAQNLVQYRRVLVAKREASTYAQALTAANQQLEILNHLKDYFVTRAAHELRTPITAILGETQLALRRMQKVKGATTELYVWKNHFENIEEMTRSLHRLIEELIDISSFRSEGVQLRIGICDFGSLCQQVIEHLRALSERSIELMLPSDPIILQADCERLSQVITNVARNAIQYAAENTVIDVYIYVKHSDVILQIHNYGPVLSDEEQEHLFEPFYRCPYAETRFREGWGLGLTISKEIVERHGGHISIESSEGNGTTCFVHIPLQTK